MPALISQNLPSKPIRSDFQEKSFFLKRTPLNFQLLSRTAELNLKPPHVQTSPKEKKNSNFLLQNSLFSSLGGKRL
jgi:hypothetical protein